MKKVLEVVSDNHGNEKTMEMKKQGWRLIAVYLPERMNRKTLFRLSRRILKTSISIHRISSLSECIPTSQAVRLWTAARAFRNL